MLETVVEEFEGPAGWNDALEDVWEMRELAPRGRIAWEVVVVREKEEEEEGKEARREGGVKVEKGTERGKLVVYPVEALDLR